MTTKYFLLSVATDMVTLPVCRISAVIKSVENEYANSESMESSHGIAHSFIHERTPKPIMWFPKITYIRAPYNLIQMSIWLWARPWNTQNYGTHNPRSNESEVFYLSTRTHIFEC